MDVRLCRCCAVQGSGHTKVAARTLTGAQARPPHHSLNPAPPPLPKAHQPLRPTDTLMHRRHSHPSRPQAHTRTLPAIVHATPSARPPSGVAPPHNHPSLQGQPACLPYTSAHTRTHPFRARIVSVLNDPPAHPARRPPRPGGSPGAPRAIPRPPHPYPCSWTHSQESV